MKFFSIDSPFITFMNKVSDLIILNVITLILCIPVFTAGAAFTALHYVLLKITRNEEGYIIRSYFKSFKANFKQATAIWLMILAVLFILMTDVVIVIRTGKEVNEWLVALWGLACICVSFIMVMVFPILAKFSNTVFRTIKNSLAIAVLQFPKTVIMVVLYLIPIVGLIVAPRVLPFCLLFGITAPAMASTALYNKFFQKMEDQILEAQSAEEETSEETQEDEVEKIFSDKLDESLIDKEQ